ncbi:unnamed protein product [Linum trigynum]|uniref:Reverse transcriptase zinc-binding domain-containing protein n=1 Tax=Linum trigynum TaxID=586398 RepID=A0AAV2D1F8_9ROSI
MIALIAGTDPSIAGSGEDITVWGMEPDGKFKLRSAYLVAAEWLRGEAIEEANAENKSQWKCLWKWPGPNRIKHFLWLALHDRLMTNAERKRRKLTSNDSCAEHIMRHCPSSQQVWRLLGIQDNIAVWDLQAGWKYT